MKKYFLLIAAILLHVFILFSLEFTAWPEMSSYAYLRNNGFLIYRDMIHPYPPILTMVLSLVYRIFSYDILTLKIFTWTMLAVNDILLYFIFNKISKKVLINAVLLFTFVLIQPFLDGNMLWFDLATVTSLLASFIFILYMKDGKKQYYVLFLIGFFLSLAGFIKQTSGIYFLLFLIYLFARKIKLTQLLCYISGFLVIAVPLFIRLIQERALVDFYNWVIYYPIFYWSKFPGYVQMQVSSKDLIILLLIFIPLVFFVFLNGKKIVKGNLSKITLGFLVCALLGIYPRFSFFHFQPALYFIFIFLLINVVKVKKYFSYFLGICLLVFMILMDSSYKEGKLNGKIRFWQEDDKNLAKNINQTVDFGQKVFLLGLNSNLYTFSKRLPAKRWTDNFGWYLEIYGVQEEILKRWKEDPPDYIVEKLPSQGYWYELATYRPKMILDYIHENYQIKSWYNGQVLYWSKK